MSMPKLSVMNDIRRSVGLEVYSWSDIEFFVLLAILALFLVVSILRVIHLKWKLVHCGEWASLGSFLLDGEVKKVTIATLLLFVLFVGKGYACIGVHSDGLYRLREGSRICGRDNFVMLGRNHLDFQLSYLYDTASFSATTWNSAGCHDGTCGTRDECNSQKGTVVNKRDKTFWKKYCTHMESDVRMNFCFWNMACVIWTTEVHVKDWWVVKEVGSYQEITSGVDGCSLDRRQLQISLGELFLLTNGERGYLCKKASFLGSPQFHSLGDLQSNNREEIDLNWDWGCSFPYLFSANICKAPVSFILSHLDQCESLPAAIGGIHFDIVGDSLHGYPVDGWPAKVDCIFDIVPDSNSTCHDPEVKIVGREGFNDDSIAVRVQGHSDGVVFLNVSCMESLLEVECDGEWTVFPLMTSVNCSFNGEKLRDTRIRVELAEEVTVDEPPAHLSYTIPLFIILLLVALALVFKLIKVVFF